MISLSAIYKHFNIAKSSEEFFYLSVDNRELDEKSIFIAIVGEKYNPLNHLDKIVSSNCKFVIYEEDSSSEDLIKDYKDKIEFLSCTDLNKTIAELGTIVCDEFKKRNGKIIAISGSNGKTTTKEMMFHLLDSIETARTICTQKNYNNHLGVPFTVFQIRENTQYAIVELGSNAPGEIEFLCKIIKPQYAVTTNIGDTHLEFFDTRENVFLEEAIVKNYASEKFYVNSDDELLKDLNGDHFVSYGENAKDFQFKINQSSVEINKIQLENKNITGKHNFINMAVAFIIADEVLSDKSNELVIAASNFKPTANRSEWISIKDIPTFLDAYNANPSSMKIALDGFKQYIEANSSQASHAIVILGDMNELGSSSDAMHRETGDYALSLGFKHYFFIGRYADSYTDNTSSHISKSPTLADAISEIDAKLKDCNFLFVKGSRSLQLERITDIK